jgi:hypothetical protein
MVGTYECTWVTYGTLGNLREYTYDRNVRERINVLGVGSTNLRWLERNISECMTVCMMVGMLGNVWNVTDHMNSHRKHMNVFQTYHFCTHEHFFKGEWLIRTPYSVQCTCTYKCLNDWNV